MLINLKLVLMEKRISQADLSQKVGITPTVLSEIIHERRCANESVRAKIASALDVSESWLFSKRARKAVRYSIARPALSDAALTRELAGINA